MSISLLVGSGAGLSLVALLKSDSPEVTTSGFGFRLGDGSGVDSFSGAENLNSLLLVVVVQFRFSRLLRSRSTLWVARTFVTTLNNVSELSLYSHLVLSEVLLSTVVV
jgi:hypothetical protein